MAALHDRTVLGIHLAAGVCWFGLVSPESKYVDDRIDRLTLEDSKLGEARALAELEESVQALLRRLQPTGVALLNAGASKQAMSPSDARRRGQLEAVVLLAAHRTSTTISRVTHDEVKKAFGTTAASKELRAVIARELAITPRTKWDNRAPAFASALVAARHAHRV